MNDKLWWKMFVRRFFFLKGSPIVYTCHNCCIHVFISTLDSLRTLTGLVVVSGRCLLNALRLYGQLSTFILRDCHQQGVPTHGAALSLSLWLEIRNSRALVQIHQTLVSLLSSPLENIKKDAWERHSLFLGWYQRIGSQEMIGNKNSLSGQSAGVNYASADMNHHRPGPHSRRAKEKKKKSSMYPLHGKIEYLVMRV